MRLLETENFVIDTCADCDVPGYVVVSARTAVLSTSQLALSAAHELGEVLALATWAVEAAVSPQRVYCASFGESGSGLHFHVFPRTEQLLAEYVRTTGQYVRTTGQAETPPNGPQLLDWARRRFPNVGSPDAIAVACQLRSMFANHVQLRQAT